MNDLVICALSLSLSFVPVLGQTISILPGPVEYLPGRAAIYDPAFYDIRGKADTGVMLSPLEYYSGVTRDMPIRCGYGEMYLRYRTPQYATGTNVIHFWATDFYYGNSGFPKKGEDPNNFDPKKSPTTTFTHAGGTVDIFIGIYAATSIGSSSITIKKGKTVVFEVKNNGTTDTHAYWAYMPKTAQEQRHVFYDGRNGGYHSFLHNFILSGVYFDAGEYTIEGKTNRSMSELGMMVDMILGYRPPVQNGVTWTAINLPTTGQVGKTVSFTATLKNSGTKPWASSHNARVRLGNNTAAIIQQPSLATTAANASKTVNYSFTLPTTAGTYTYYFQTAENGTGEFGAAQSRTITVYPTTTATVSTTGVEYYTGAPVSLHGIFTASGGKLTNTRIQVYNSSGQLVFNQSYTGISASSHNPTASWGIPLGLSAGNYTLKGASSADNGNTWTEAAPKTLKLHYGIEERTIYSESWPAGGKEIWFQKSDTANKAYRMQKLNE